MDVFKSQYEMIQRKGNHYFVFAKRCPPQIMFTLEGKL